MFILSKLCLFSVNYVYYEFMTASIMRNLTMFIVRKLTMFMRTTSSVHISKTCLCNIQIFFQL